MVGMDAPYYVYNLLSELDAPGEWYIDSDTGKLYFYPPDRIAGGEILVSTLDAPLVVMNNASNTVLSGLTMEVTRRNAVDIKNGRNNMIVKSTVRNTGQWAIFVDGGWEHKVIGCDMHGMGEGGVSLRGGDRIKLIPDGHVVDNNHIYSFNRFDGGYRQAVIIDGIGERVSHNVIHDSPMQAIYLNANDNIIEFNEIHDVPYEGREIGSVYMYGEPWYLMSRGDVIRNNFFHHISTHSSPNTNQGLNAIHIDAINGGIVMGKNIFYKIPNGISNSQPENRLENNMFIDAEIRGISQGNRAYLFNTPDGEPLADRISALAAGYLKKVHYKQPPWSYRYPQLVDLLFREKPVGWAQNNVIERNINTGGAFLSISGGIKEDNIIRNNWDGDNPLFIDKDRMNFNIRPGSPVYGITGCEPLAMEDIGVYKDEFRASWPINRTKEDIGKYYKADWKPLEELAKTAMAPLRRVSPPAYYNVALRKNPIVINGKLEKDEWDGLGMKNAMVISQQYQGNKTEGAKSNAWLLYDKDNLYIALKHDPDPYTGNMPARLKKHVPIFEIAIESQNGSQSRSWWIDDMVTGPIYSITGNYAGEFWINNMFGMPNSIVKKLEQSVEYKVSIQDENSQAWTAEMKIPFAGIGVNIADAQQLAFNIGTYKRADWFAWVATGSYIWRVENAGSIKFVK